MCDQGPAMLVNNEVYAKLTPHKVVEILDELKVKVKICQY